MLKELRVANFAIIDRVELQFSQGLIIFTGETGAGKSILIDAVETLLGGRAESTMVRSGAERASIEGIFQIPETIRNFINSILEHEDLIDDPEFITLAREIRISGRNTARINGRSVNATLLREIGAHLVDVHGQSEHLSLLRVAQHLSLLDNYAGVEQLLSQYQDTYHQLQGVRTELQQHRQAEKEAARLTDTLSYQINEIESAHLQPEEEDTLLEERNRLANAEELATLAQEAIVALDEGTPETPAATDLIGQVVQALGSLAKLDTSQATLDQQAHFLFDSLADVSRDLRSYLDKIEFNPKRLDRIEERLALIQNLKRKYGDTLVNVLAYASGARQQLEKITHAAERIHELEESEERLLSQLGQEGLALSEKRRQQAEKLGNAIESELVDLNMSHTRFKVEFQRKPDPNGVPINGERIHFDASGLDRVEFLIAPNPGEGFKPLVKIASGGETSRLMLALKNVLASADHIQTLIFDEIDQGIGGRVGGIVGQKLSSLAHQHQVFCVTHLPQLAAYGVQHYNVEKQIVVGRTITQVKLLKGDQRVYELSQMLGGVSEATLESAREILNSADQAPSQTNLS